MRKREKGCGKKNEKQFLAGWFGPVSSRQAIDHIYKLTYFYTPTMLCSIVHIFIRAPSDNVALRFETTLRFKSYIIGYMRKKSLVSKRHTLEMLGDGNY